MTSSCSFRIARTAEDLAQTITALSQRLVKLEQRQESLELQVIQQQEQPIAEDLERLDGVDQLLQECQDLLAQSSQNNDSHNIVLEDDQQNDVMAA